MSRETRVEIYHSFLEENQAEYRRRAHMTPEERWVELALLQQRVWGEAWHLRPIVRRATWEDLPW